MHYDEALSSLRQVLLETQPTGDGGFEGLIASVLAAQSGLLIRLAKSGSQFGRDASSVFGDFAIAMEAKRYREDELRLELLAGKVFVAAHLLEIDLWVVGTTSAVGDNTVDKLRSILEENGIAFLCLDWALYPMPPLAVALAAEIQVTLDWFARHNPAVDRSRLEEALLSVRGHATFSVEAARLREQLHGSTVGVDSLRHQSSNWLRSRLIDPFSSQQSFGQIILVAGANNPGVTRIKAAADLQSALDSAATRPKVIAVLGEEGTGKTWLVARWWSAHAHPPRRSSTSWSTDRSLP